MNDLPNLSVTISKFFDAVNKVKQKSGSSLTTAEAADIIFKLLDHRGSFEDELDEVDFNEDEEDNECTHCDLGCDCEHGCEKFKCNDEDENDEESFFLDKLVDHRGRLYLSVYDIAKLISESRTDSLWNKKQLTYAYLDGLTEDCGLAFIAPDESFFKTKKFKNFLKTNIVGDIYYKDFKFKTINLVDSTFFQFRANPFRFNSKVFMYYDEDADIIAIENDDSI